MSDAKCLFYVVQIIATLLATPQAVLSQPLAPSRVAVAWNDTMTSTGMVRAISTSAPWGFVSEPLQVGRNPVMRFAFGRIYVLSTEEGTIQVVAPQTWTVERTYSLGPASGPVDIAVVDPQTAYVTQRDARYLSRLDLVSGIPHNVADLGLFADSDGIPDLGTMVVNEGRLFVQIQRLHPDEPPGYVSPGYLAIVDVVSGRLIDVDPVVSGIQAIELMGTFPKLKMQVIDETNQLFVSATGGFFDAGGIEVINTETLQSEGLVIEEADGMTGADLGPFVMTDPESGFLTYSTDFTISSHLHRFSLSSGVEPDQLHVAVDYLAPGLAFDSQTNNLFFPNGGGQDKGVHVFDALTGERLTRDLIPTSGPPTDLILIGAAIVADYNQNGTVDAADYVLWRETLGQTGAGLAADGNGNGTIESGDYDIWRAHFGQMAASGSALVPEPSPYLLVAMTILGLLLHSRTQAAFPRAGCKGYADFSLTLPPGPARGAPHVPIVPIVCHFQTIIFMKKKGGGETATTGTVAIIKRSGSIGTIGTCGTGRRSGAVCGMLTN